MYKYPLLIEPNLECQETDIINDSFLNDAVQQVFCNINHYLWSTNFK